MVISLPVIKTLCYIAWKSHQQLVSAADDHTASLAFTIMMLKTNQLINGDKHLHAITGRWQP